MRVQSKVAEYIHEKGYKKSHVAEKAGIRISRFSEILNNHSEMRADELEKICIALEVNPSKFIDETQKIE